MGDLDKKSSKISSESNSMVVPNNGTEQGHEEVMSKERNLNREGGPSADLSEARTVKDLEKKEHPFNQRRALLKARKMCKRSKAQIASAEVVGCLKHFVSIIKRGNKSCASCGGAASIFQYRSRRTNWTLMSLSFLSQVPAILLPHTGNSKRLTVLGLHTRICVSVAKQSEATWQYEFNRDMHLKINKIVLIPPVSTETNL
ncbi:hypothetical protein H0E87_030679 [Populus deltoides]|uniref:Uncharacterized protein n=1 Tax=Populus deltoides TaxID=3696 RepID=A0A8T2WKI9_POPDE|nr:hypothetical protein H0E87_030679 [Populus deltoides]